MVSYTQDWARLLYVGDVQFLLTKRSLPFDSNDVPEEFKKVGKVVFFFEIEFHLNDDEHYYHYWCQDREERDLNFSEITEEELKVLLHVELGYDIS